MKIYVGSPIYRDVVVEHHDAMWMLQALVNKTPSVELVKATVRGDADVGRARNVAASGFLESDADVLLTIDGDIWLDYFKRGPEGDGLASSSLEPFAQTVWT